MHPCSIIVSGNHSPSSRLIRATLFLALFIVSAGTASAQGLGEYGDAPEGQTAYPGTAIPGLFPTCLGGPSGKIQHAPNVPPGAANAWFGPTWDLESDGNAGLCAPPNYEQDECWTGFDNDAGLLRPTSWTFDPSLNQGVPCPPGTPQSLGPACGVAVWGTDIDMSVHNTLGQTAYLNVLVDWDRSGNWNGGSFCGIEFVPEWLVRDLPVPPFYHGAMPGLSAAPFRIGPADGFVWVRFVLSDQPIQSLVGPVWDGSVPITLDAGETEDYMVRIDPFSGPAEFGDAPEDALAYPPEGTLGRFPTCVTGGGGYVSHADPSALFLGPAADLESDGNAGSCAFPDYDRDECGPAGDAGLVVPDPWTIDANLAYVPCGGPGPRSLGDACGLALLGANLDVSVTNTLASSAWLNVLIDWDRDGDWGGSFACPIGGAADEHVIVNEPIPAGYSGLLSGLTSTAFPIPSMPGFVWMRVSVTDQPVAANWDGSGTFAKGETEDYLVEIASPGLGDYGDAPEGTIAYPSLGVVGFFPTCVSTGPDGFIYHRGASGEHIGAGRDFETEGDAGPPCAFPAFDDDECGLPGGDAGLLVPDAFTIDASGTAEVPCVPGATRPLGASCSTGVIGVDLDIDVTSTLPFDLYFNLLVDWRQDGRWNGAYTCAIGVQADDHLIQNLVIPPFYSGPISGLLGPLPFNIPAATGYVWARATLSETPQPGNWDGSGFFTYGETEDYLLLIGSVSGSPAVSPPAPLALGPALPNPFGAGSVEIRYVAAAPGAVRLSVFDVAGRLVRSEERIAEAGPGRWTWDGRDAGGAPAPGGLYVVRIESGGSVRSLKITRVADRP